MAWFKKKETLSSIENNDTSSPVSAASPPFPCSGIEEIKVLGSGCAKCNQLADAAKQALAQVGCNTVVEHVTDFAQIANYGVMSTPALVINGKVVSFGKVLKTKEVVELLNKMEAP